MGLDIKLDFTDAATAKLDVVAGDGNLLSAAVALDLPLDRMDVLNGIEVEMPSPYEGPQLQQELLAKRYVAGHRPGLDHRGSFPVLAGRFIIGQC